MDPLNTYCFIFVVTLSVINACIARLYDISNTKGQSDGYFIGISAFTMSLFTGLAASFIMPVLVTVAIFLGLFDRPPLEDEDITKKDE